MARNRSKYPAKTTHNDSTTDVASFTGAGAAAIVVSAAAVLAAGANYAVPAGTNKATVITRNGVGDHTLTFADAPTRVLHVDPQTYGTTALKAVITTRTQNVGGTFTVRVLTFTPAGVAADMAATDFLTIYVYGSDSTV